ncbi:hypothetical protein OG417_01645 [Actinoallomurus sp. NBC_01490]|uniref:hypothetical protein n=1 Tax=Actinoallomurus sp. NBC_01490 TaxID=2903557 RepID=UPI002E37CF34|nr:hypothetical protein [Actinoallomurus sp. NBC_01490]
MARRVDPATPTACALGRQVVRPGAVDLGEAGVRFPRALPMSLPGSTAGAFFLSVALGTLRFDHDDAVTEGLLVWCGLSAVPLIAGVVWWPLLRAAMSGGLAPRTVARVGWIYVTTGVLSALVSGGAVCAAGAGAANLGTRAVRSRPRGRLARVAGRIGLTFARSLGDGYRPATRTEPDAGDGDRSCPVRRGRTRDHAGGHPPGTAVRRRARRPARTRRRGRPNAAAAPPSSALSARS